MKNHSRASIILFSVIMLTIITTNVHAMTVDINSRTNNQSNPVAIFLDAGTYMVEPIGTAEGGSYCAWNAWGSTSCTNPNGCQRTRPTTVTGWMNSYSVISSDIANVEVGGATLSPISTPGSGLETYFLVDNYYSVQDGLAYPTALNALAGAQESMFTLTTAGFVGFSIRDTLFMTTKEEFLSTSILFLFQVQLGYSVPVLLVLLV